MPEAGTLDEHFFISLLWTTLDEHLMILINLNLIVGSYAPPCQILFQFWRILSIIFKQLFQLRIVKLIRNQILLNLFLHFFFNYILDVFLLKLLDDLICNIKLLNSVDADLFQL